MLRADRDRHDLGGLALLLQPDRLLDGDLVEGVHRHLDVGELDARTVRLDADLHVVVDHPFDGDENFHGRFLLRYGEFRILLRHSSRKGVPLGKRLKRRAGKV